MGADTAMAISNYLGALLAVLILYPFALVALQIAIFSPSKRKRVTRRFNFVAAIAAVILLVLHMQTEVIYGKELLDRYYAEHGTEASLLPKEHSQPDMGQGDK